MPDTTQTTALDHDAINALLAEVFPQIGEQYQVRAVEYHRAEVSLDAGFDELRPGGTVSGPALFGLVDLAAYVATMARIGPETLTVTSSASIHFLRKPPPGRLLAEAKVLRQGRSLVVSEVSVRHEDGGEPVVHATVTYSVPTRS